MNYQTKISLSLLLSLFGLQSYAQEPKSYLIAFPGHSRVSSPDELYALINIDSGTEPYHTVLLEDRRLKTQRTLLHYGRSVEVLWNPDSKSFALTNYEGSNVSSCKIIYVDQKVPTIDVWDEILKRIGADGRKPL